ncbi:MAG: hypothetical protein H0W84_11935 [Bacteroidetes bacterium]|nr:hypothetical protein [Bacteroidota bacterium]
MEVPHFYWKVYTNVVKLVSFAFDGNHYYREESMLADKLCPPSSFVPAWTVMDIQKFFPPYLVSSSGTDCFEISIDSNYPCEPCIANRLPDAFAKMMLLGISKRIFQKETIKSNGHEKNI